ncbi:hypothetical protein LCGC14_0876600 [marine sediment metagenome]|uniref:Uncharacterized protein n=1 Tax=marine sediment metagenome TaxID=412755 RepID=A0A0F9SA47_9ZZZZ|nr:hypothetical protein [bacterium]
MTNTFEKWHNKANRITHELRLIIKNGLKYKVSLTSNKTPKKRKFKQINAKKWQIKGLFLEDFEIVGKTEIQKIIENDAKEQQSYDRAFSMTKGEVYNILFTDKQYKTFCKFLETAEIQLKQEFYIQRKGIGLKTIMRFTVN